MEISCFRGSHRVLLLLVILFSPIFCLAEVSPPLPLVIDFLDVGYGDAIVVRFPEGGSMMIDGGDPEHGPQVAARLRDLGIVRLDYVVISHFHKDHAGGLNAILQEFLWISCKWRGE